MNEGLEILASKEGWTQKRYAITANFVQAHETLIQHLIIPVNEKNDEHTKFTTSKENVTNRGCRLILKEKTDESKNFTKALLGIFGDTKFVDDLSKLFAQQMKKILDNAYVGDVNNSKIEISKSKKGDQYFVSIYLDNSDGKLISEETVLGSEEGNYEMLNAENLYGFRITVILPKNNEQDTFKFVTISPMFRYEKK